ncbi:MAG: hypothetical protein ACFBSE_20595 [Prochloraceae cyanobacterium]
MTATATKGRKFDYKDAFDEELQAEAEALANALSQNYRLLYSYVDQIRIFYKKIQAKHFWQPELGEKIFAEYQKNAPFLFAENLRSFIFNLAKDTCDFTQDLWELFVEKICKWKLSLPKIKSLSQLEDREKLLEFLNQKTIPSKKEITNFLPQKPLTKIPANKSLSQKYFDLAINSFNLDESQISWLKKQMELLAEERGDEKITTNHLVIILARCLHFQDLPINISYRAHLTRVFSDYCDEISSRELDRLNFLSQEAIYENKIISLREKNAKLEADNEDVTSHANEYINHTKDILKDVLEKNNKLNQQIAELKAENAELKKDKESKELASASD